MYELRGFDPRKIEVIPNAVDGEAFSSFSRDGEEGVLSSFSRDGEEKRR